MKNILSILAIMVCSFQLNAQSGGILWVGSGKSIMLNIPDNLKGEASAETVTRTEAINTEKLKGTAIMRINPDGKIVSIEIRPDKRTLIDPNCLRSAIAYQECVNNCAGSPFPIGCIMGCIIYVF